MGLFDRFKKKEEPSYDVTNIQVYDLDIGFIFDYDLSTWRVESKYNYDWGGHYFTNEFQVSNGSETRYLSVEKDDDLSLSWMQKIKLRKLDDDLFDDLVENQKPPRKIVFENETYRIGETSMGYFKDCSKKGDNWEEVRVWDFENEDGTKIISIEQWDDDEFEASCGLNIKEFEISNILPT